MKKFGRLRRLTKIVLLSTLFLMGQLSSYRIVEAQRGRCGDQAICVDPFFNTCIPVPTTLPPVSPTWSGGYGFRPASSNCGAKRCYWLFACACGPPLSGDGLCVPGTPNGASGFCSN